MILFASLASAQLNTNTTHAPTYKPPGEYRVANLGRYQIISGIRPGEYTNSPCVYRLDTITGQAWTLEHVTYHDAPNSTNEAPFWIPIAEDYQTITNTPTKISKPTK
jgi:hypothetical protein